MRQRMIILLGCFLGSLAFLWPAQGQQSSDNLVITGVIKDKENRKELENVNISVVGSSIGTVSNEDGVFSLKVSKATAGRGLVFSHVGYLNSHLSIETIEKQSDRLTIWMTPTAQMLDEVHVYGGTPRDLVEKAIEKIPQNYADKENLFSAFYRETIQKGRRYIGISEAVMNVYKTAYSKRVANYDRVQLSKGRRLMSQKRSDTLAIKIVGGPSLSVFLDVVKNGEELLALEYLNQYEFTMDKPVSLDNRMQYVVRFQPAVCLDYALYVGKLYIDQERLAFTRAEFELDMSNRDKAMRAILYKKPAGLYFKPQEASFLITYKQQGDKTYLNYIRNVMRFKCDWKKRLFSSTFTTYSEMVMVDREEEGVESIRYKDAFKQRQVFYDAVNEYWDEDFWKDYNIIEPTESLESAVNKLKKRR